MRVTNSMMTNKLLRDINKNLSTMNKLNVQMSSGKKYSKPSDNSVETSKIMQIKSEIKINNQFATNISDSLNFLENTDSSLGRLNESVQRIRDLTITAGNAAYGSDELKNIKTEINEKINEISQILNTSYSGIHIFGGTKTNSKPISVIVNSNGNNELCFSGKNGEILNVDDLDDDVQNQINSLGQKLTTEICDGVYSEYNVTAMNVLVVNKGKENEVNFMTSLSNLLNGLNDSESISNTVSNALDDLDMFINNINTTRALVGTKQNRLEEALSQNEDNALNLEEMLSSIEDIDQVEKSIEITSMQTAYVASLQTSSYIMQTSLLDFIK